MKPVDEVMSHYNEVLTYCKDIISSKILSGQYCKKAIRRFLRDLDHQEDEGFPYAFIPDLADTVIDFAECLIIPDISTEDKKLKLLPWMKFVYYNLYGWVYKADHERRRFRSGYIEVSRKNSKTTSILFPLIIYDFLVTDASESYFVSKDVYQSDKCFRELKNVIRADMELKQVINETVYAVTYKNSRISFFTSESGGLDSYKNSMSVIDEYHAYDNDKAVTAFRYGGRARKNCLVLIITSAGTDISKPCYAENEKARKVLNNILTDETYFSIIYSYDDKDDWTDPKLLIKANPSLGVVIEQSILENDLNDAVITPSHQADFKSKTCGIWTNSATNWIPLSTWEECLPDEEPDYNELKDCICCGALDLSSVSDFTAYTLCFYKEGKYYFKHRFYVPESTVQKRYKSENINIQDWVNKGIVTAIPGKVIDTSYVFNDIYNDAEYFNIYEIAYDKWSAQRFIDELNENLPSITYVDFSQSLKKMSQPSKDYERCILEKTLIDTNLVMKWMISNATIKPTVNGDYKPLKENPSSKRRIDGVVTSIMAHNRCMVAVANTFSPATNFEDILKLF